MNNGYNVRFVNVYAEKNKIENNGGGGFNILNSYNVTFSNLTLKENMVSDDGGMGGGMELY